ELGLTHGMLETELFAGIVELVARDPAEAAGHLRIAYEGFRQMGVGVDAARAGTFLARAQLLMGNGEEANRLSTEAVGLDADVESSILWRGVRAEILAARGEVDEARRVAQSAVEIASRTDALFEHGSACNALAAVCPVAGDAERAGRASEP